MIRIILIIFFQVTLLFNGNPVNKYSERSWMSDSTSHQIIIDSDYTLDEALNGVKIPDTVRKELALIKVQYYSFDNKLHQGQIVLRRDLCNDIIKIFEKIKEERFPVAKVIPIVRYNWNDEESMEDNNTSAFNYRFIAGMKKLSNHSFGTAIDINPLLNPYIRPDLHQPEGSEYNIRQKGTITKDSFLVEEFKKLGWEWGGDWKEVKDYQHFQKLTK